MTVPNNANTYLPPVVAIPSALTITAITQTNPMVVTVSANTDQSNTYIPGQQVLLRVPITYGMYQADGLQGLITAVNGSQLTLNINASGFDPFVVPSSGEQPATLAPCGSRNLQYSNTTNQISFQSLNNIGN